jgi:predicted MFS family arabinose efflux permease
MDFFGVRANFYVMTVLCLIAFLIVLVFLPTLGKVGRTDVGDLPRYGAILKSFRMWGLFVFRSTSAVARGVLMAFLPVAAVRYAAMSPAQIGLAVSSNVLLMAFLQGPLGRVADRGDRLKLVMIGSALSTGMMAALPLISGFGQVVSLCLLMGAAASLSMPAAMALIVVEGRTYGQGSVSGFFNLGMSIGLGLGPILAGRVVDLFGLSFAFYFAALVGLAGSLAFGRMAAIDQVHESNQLALPNSRQSEDVA